MGLRLKILNQFGIPEALNSPDEIEVHFPYESADALVKRMSYGAVKVLSDQTGEIEVTLDPFEVQGIPLGEKQNFSVKLIYGDQSKEAIFNRALNVRMMDTEDGPRKVIER